jgi:hypothetical protein
MCDGRYALACQEQTGEDTVFRSGNTDHDETTDYFAELILAPSTLTSCWA